MNDSSISFENLSKAVLIRLEEGTKTARNKVVEICSKASNSDLSDDSTTIESIVFY